MFSKIGRFVPVLLSLFTMARVHAQSWQRYVDSAVYYKAQRKTDESIAAWLKARNAIPADSSNSILAFTIDTALGQAYFDKSRMKDAHPFVSDALRNTEGRIGRDNDQYASIEIMLGKIDYSLRNFDDAERDYLEALAILDKLPAGRNLKYAGACNAIGILYNDARNYEMAVAYHTRAMEIRSREGTENAAFAQSCNNLGAVYWRMGQLDKADPLAIRAWQLRSRLKEVPARDYAISCVSLANISRDLGKYDEAEKLYIEAKDIRERVFTKQHASYINTCDILADLYYFMHRYESAESLYLEAMQLRETNEDTDSYEYGQSCNNLAALYRDEAHYDKAERLALQARTVWLKLTQAGDSHIAINDNNLGALYLAIGDLARSEKYFMEARTIWEKNLGRGHPYFIESSASLGRLYWNSGDPAKAANYYKEAIDGQYGQLQKIFAFTSDREKQLYLQNIDDAQDEYYSFFSAPPTTVNSGEAYTLSLLRRNLILASARRQRSIIHQMRDSIMDETYAGWTTLKQRLSSLYAQGSKIDDEQVRSLSSRADSIEKVLSRASNEFAKQANPVPDWKNIRARLKPNEAAIEFITFDYFNGKSYTDSSCYAALILRGKDRSPISVPLCSQSRLDSVLRLVNSDAGINFIYTRGLKAKKSARVSIPLYNLVWKPLESGLAGVDHIYFAPAGSLHRIAFAALPIDSSRLLSDRYRLTQLASTESLVDLNDGRLEAADDIRVYGAIDYDAGMETPTQKGFSYLGGTEKEVGDIMREGSSNKYRLTLIRGDHANEASIKELDGDRSPAVLHIATHGFFFPDVANTGSANDDASGGINFRNAPDPMMRSGLIFAGGNRNWFANAAGSDDDGVLTAYEVSNLYLPHTKLVVLSACETALGDIKGSEGVYGLQRAFKMAGVNNLVMSLWKVPDPETAKFMSLFYKYMFDKQTIDDAFYHAQADMKRDHRKDPFKWAAWVLIR